MRATLTMMLITIALAQSIFLIPNCILHNPDQAQCLVCSLGYQLATGKCQQCLPNYGLINGLCLPLNSQPTTTTNSNQAANIANQLFSNSDFIFALKALIQNQVLQSNAVVKTNPCTQIINNACVSCSPNFVLKNGMCTASTSSIAIQPNPVTPASNQPLTVPQVTTNLPGLVTGNTQTNNQNGAYIPFYIITKPVTLPYQISNPYIDSNCKLVNQLLNICDECYYGFYFSKANSSCIPTNPLCQNVTKSNQCISCYDGYSLNNGQCIQNKNISNVDKNCKMYQSGICSQCYDGYYLSIANACLKSNSACKTVDENNLCTSCYSNYLLIYNICYLRVSGDQFCTNFTDICHSCANRYYLSPAGICTEVDQNCKDYTKEGVCTLCYVGYRVKDGTCQLLNLNDQQQSSDNDIMCPFRSIPINGVCKEVNTQCHTWNQTNGDCLSCYGGYLLEGALCVRG